RHHWPDMEGLDDRDTVTDFALPEGTFFDIAMVHLLTTATLDRLRELWAQARRALRSMPPRPLGASALLHSLVVSFGGSRVGRARVTRPAALSCPLRRNPPMHPRRLTLCAAALLTLVGAAAALAAPARPVPHAAAHAAAKPMAMPALSRADMDTTCPPCRDF